MTLFCTFDLPFEKERTACHNDPVRDRMYHAQRPVANRILTILLLLTALTASAQGRLTINGLVTKQGAPLDGAEVKIFKTSGGLQYAYGNNTGKFRTVLDLGQEYIISVTEPGFATRSMTILTETPKETRGEFEQDIVLDLQPMRKDGKGNYGCRRPAG